MQKYGKFPENSPVILVYRAVSFFFAKFDSAGGNHMHQTNHEIRRLQNQAEYCIAAARYKAAAFFFSTKSDIPAAGRPPPVAVWKRTKGNRT